MLIETLQALGSQNQLQREKAVKQMADTFKPEDTRLVEIVLTMLSNSRRWQDRLGAMLGYEVLSIHQARPQSYFDTEVFEWTQDPEYKVRSYVGPHLASIKWTGGEPSKLGKHLLQLISAESQDKDYWKHVETSLIALKGLLESTKDKEIVT